MKSFKEYLSSLTESTVPEDLEHIPESWDHHSHVSAETAEKIDAALGGKQHVRFPLQMNEHVDVDPDVHEHLSKHGYHITDYVKGLAATAKRVGNDKVGYRNKLVEERIGSVLEKTHAPDYVKSSFMNDAGRQATKSSDHHVCITTTPHGIAGMSIGTAWDDQSCMNLRSGSNRNHLKDDSEHGTHVAYLVKHDDKGAHYGEPDAPLARIALKPYHRVNSIDDHASIQDDTIFRPEEKTYGAESSHFKNAVSAWADKHYPIKPGAIYRKNRYVYDDTNNSEYKALSKDDVERHIDTGMFDPFSVGHQDHDVISHAISHGSKKFAGTPADVGAFVKSMATFRNLTNKHVFDLNNLAVESNQHNAENTFAFYHGDKFSTNHLRQYFDRNMRGNETPTNRILMNKKLPDDIVDAIEPSRYAYVHGSKIKPHHIDKILDHTINDNGYSSHSLVTHFDKVSKPQLERLVDNVGTHSSNLPNITHKIVEHKDFNKNMHNRLIKGLEDGDSPRAASIMRNSPFASVDDFGAFNKKAITNKTLVTAMAKNEILPAVEEIKLKNHIVNDSRDWHTLPDAIARHLTDADYVKLAKDNRNMSFMSPEHSNQLLDAYEKQLKHHDVEAETSGDNTMLHKTAESYGTQLQDHVNDHVEGYNHNFDAFPKSIDELNKSQDRLYGLEKLKSYKTPDNSDEHEHYDDNFKDIRWQLNKLTDALHDH